MGMKSKCCKKFKKKGKWCKKCPKKPLDIDLTFTHC